MLHITFCTMEVCENGLNKTKKCTEYASEAYQK